MKNIQFYKSKWFNDLTYNNRMKRVDPTLIPIIEYCIHRYEDNTFSINDIINYNDTDINPSCGVIVISYLTDRQLEYMWEYYDEWNKLRNIHK